MVCYELERRCFPSQTTRLKKVEAERLPIPLGLCGITLNTIRLRGGHGDNNQSLSRPANGGFIRPPLLIELVGDRRTLFKEFEIIFEKVLRALRGGLREGISGASPSANV